VVGCGVEIVLLLLVCGALFFVGLGRFDFIKTEGLRAIVVAEMLERPGVSMPTVHHQPQTKKPPLYAWTTTALARAVGRFDEQIARLPSAMAGTLLIVLLYGVAERAFGRGAGVIAAALALANPTLLDYSVRAELDLGFTLLTTLAILLAYPALRRAGATAVFCWMGCYAAATLAAMWKGPHSLIFLWVTLLAYGWGKRYWRWLWHPAHVVGLVMSLGLLVSWAVLLSAIVGPRAVAEIAVIELVSRLVPLSVGDLLSIVYAVPMLVVIVLPASAFMVASLRRGVIYEADDQPADRSFGGLVRFCAGRFRAWWRAVAGDPFAEFLLFWVSANLAWCAIVPAKAPRYWLPLCVPVFLLSAYLLRRRLAGRVSEVGQRHLDVTWRLIYGVIGALGLVGLAGAVLVLARPGVKVASVSLGPAWAWLALGTGWTVMAAVELARRRAWPTIGRCVGLLVVVLAARPALSEVWWPARARSDTQRFNAAALDAIVPPGEPVYVLGRHELPDVEFYSRRRFEWPGHPDGIAPFRPSDGAFCLLRAEDLEGVVARCGYSYGLALEFERADKRLVLIQIDLGRRLPESDDK
jgi:4-amino-4-deoxy-L-arabinose transferase-like glycosyltransferase